LVRLAAGKPALPPGKAFRLPPKREKKKGGAGCGLLEGERVPLCRKGMLILFRAHKGVKN